MPPDLPTIGHAHADEGHAVLVCGDAAYRLTPSALSTLHALVEAATPTPMRRELAAALKLTCERALAGQRHALAGHRHAVVAADDLSAVRLPTIWEVGDERANLSVDILGSPRVPDGAGAVWLGSVVRHSAGDYHVWTSVMRGVNGPPGFFPTRLAAQRALLAALSAPLAPPRAEAAPTTIPAAPVPLAPAQLLLPERDRPAPPTAPGLTAEQLTTYHHLTPEERCLVDAMRRDAGGHVGQVRDGADYLYLPPNRPVGRLPAMFSLIGRGICEYRDGDRYALVDAWRDPLPAVT